MDGNNRFLVTATISFMYAALVAFFAITKNDISMIKDMYLLVALWAPSPMTQSKQSNSSQSSIDPDAIASTVVTTTSVSAPLPPIEYK